jgi:hypothetical protein
VSPSKDIPFSGFPGIAQATAIPNVFFAAVLPRLREPGELLAFLWVARLTQAQRGEVRFANADQVWNTEGAPASFEQLAGGRAGLDHGLQACARIGALLSLRLAGPDGEEAVYFVNNPASRRAVGRARAGAPPEAGDDRRGAGRRERPGIFRLYEENVGTIRPSWASGCSKPSRLYPHEWIRTRSARRRR